MIQVEELSFSYAEKMILKNVGFTAEKGECVALLGNNGAGKSTLITCMNGIHKPSHGRVLLNGEDVLSYTRLQRAQCISYVPQKNEISRMTVFDCVLMGRKPYIKWSVEESDLKKCEDVLEKLHLSDLRMRYVDELSGGELQKVMLARSLVQEPQLLLLDEPTNNLDPKNQYDMMKLVKEVARERNLTAVLVLHDLNLALRYCDRFVFLKDGVITGDGKAEIVTEKMIMDVYGMSSKVIRAEGVPLVLLDA